MSDATEKVMRISRIVAALGLIPLVIYWLVLWFFYIWATAPVVCSFIERASLSGVPVAVGLVLIIVVSSIYLEEN